MNLHHANALQTIIAIFCCSLCVTVSGQCRWENMPLSDFVENAGGVVRINEPYPQDIIEFGGTDGAYFSSGTVETSNGVVSYTFDAEVAFGPDLMTASISQFELEVTRDLANGLLLGQLDVAVIGTCSTTGENMASSGNMQIVCTLPPGAIAEVNMFTTRCFPFFQVAGLNTTLVTNETNKTQTYTFDLEASDEFVFCDPPNSTVSGTVLALATVGFPQGSSALGTATAQLVVNGGTNISTQGFTLLGDVNLDGSVNLLDVDPFIDLLSLGEYQFEADIDGNGVVNLLDVDPFILLLSGG